MKHLLLLVLSLTMILPVASRAQKVETTEIQLICGGDELLIELSRKYGEQPALIGDAQIMQSEKFIPGLTLVYINPKTGSYTVLAKIENRYCVVAAGSRLLPVQINTL